MSDTTHRIPHRGHAPREGGCICAVVRDVSGNVLPLAAVGTLILAGLVGGGVDMARAYKAERRLQAACDAGVLAGRRAVTTDGFDTAALNQANQYFDANFESTTEDTSAAVFSATSDDGGNTVAGTATASQDTVIMKIFGFSTMPLSVSCTASMGIGNSDVMFVLDNTGSMAREPDGSFASTFEESKMFALQEAMKAFYDTVAAANGGAGARIRYGFVPYSTNVRVGQLIQALDPDFLTDEVTVQSVQYVNWNATPINTWSDPDFTYTSASYGSWSHHTSTKYSSSSNCNPNRPADTAWSDNGAPYTYQTSYSVEAATGNQVKTLGWHQPQTMTDYECRRSGSDWYVDKRTGTRGKRSTEYEERTPDLVTTAGATFTTAVLQQRTFNSSNYKNFQDVTLPIGVNNGSVPNRTANVTSTWPGCIIERETSPVASFSFVSLLTGIDPSAALDLNIDMAPTDDPATQWQPLWPEVTFFRDQFGSLFENLDDGGNGSVSSSEYSENLADSPCPQEAQLLAEMDEGDFDEYAESLVPTGNTYHDSGLIWGARLSSPTGLWADVVNEEPGNGGTVSRHMIFMTDGALDTDRWVNTLYGIERHDMRVTGSGNSDNEQLARHRSRYLAVCEAIKARGIRLWVVAFGTTLTADLQTCSSPDSSFQADDAEELNANFQEIANQVGELRIMQ
jgi:Flp pilus assembly protein TadG